MLQSPRRAPARSLVSLLCLALLSLFATAAVASAASRHGGHSVSAPTQSALRAAAARSSRADRRLVVEARALSGCLRRASGRSGACRATRASVQSSGHAFASAQRKLAALAVRTAHARRAGRWPGWRVPVLRANGYRLNWSAIRRATDYVLVSEVPGEANRYSVLGANSATPPPVPGVTVTYMVRTAWRNSQWSNPVRVSYPAAPPAPIPTPPAGPPAEELDQRAAPALHVSGQTLSWNLVAHVSTYVLVTKVPGQAESFSSVNGTSTTPPAVAGKTVHYSVRTAVQGSAWAPEVSISYPAPPPPPPPPSEPPVNPGAGEGFQPGINSGTNPLDYTGAVTLGARVVRVEFPIGAPASALESTVANYAAKGIRVAPLAGFYGRLPSSAEAQSLASWAKEFGPGGTFWAGHSGGSLAIRTIEFGNETSYGYQYGDNAGDPSYQARAQTYAVRLKEAAQAISAAGSKVGLLAVADDPSGNWMNGMFSAVPNLGSYVAGWVSHPYGTYGRTKLQGVISQTAAHGASSSIPIDITEWGLSTDGSSCVYENYGFNPCMSYQEAGEQLKRSVAEIKAMLGNRIGLFLLYQVRDQQQPGASKEREAYFGLLQHEDASKGPYTQAAQEVLAS